MKRIVFGMMFVFCLFSFVVAEGGPYELTKVDIFSIKKSISGPDVAVMGVTINTPLADALKMLNKTTADIETRGRYGFVEVKPGFKLRIVNDKINALLVSDEFKGSLVGATAALFNNIDTSDTFKTYVVKYFLKPDKSDESSVAGFESYTIGYYTGIVFTRFGSREGNSCTICFQELGIID